MIAYCSTVWGNQTQRDYIRAVQKYLLYEIELFIKHIESNLPTVGLKMTQF